jgi:hypothetical protein
MAAVFLNGLDLAAPADTQPRLSLLGSAAPAIQFGPGGSTAVDAYIRRSAAKTLVVDTDGASGALTLVNVVSTGLQWNGLPVSQAVGQVVTLNFVIDGGGALIATGIHGDLVVDFAATITAVTLLADQTAHGLDHHDRGGRRAPLQHQLGERDPAPDPESKSPADLAAA